VGKMHWEKCVGEKEIWDFVDLGKVHGGKKNSGLCCRWEKNFGTLLLVGRMQWEKCILEK